MTHPNYLTRERKSSELSELEIATLAGVSRSTISRAEIGDDPPSLRVALALQVIFCAELSGLFPSLFTHIQDGVLERALSMDEAIRKDESPDAKRKRAFLRRLVAGNNPLPA